MSYNWDIKILYPSLFILIAFSLIMYWKKSKYLKKHGIFFVQQFCFWCSIYMFTDFNNNYSIFIFLNYDITIWIIMFFSLTFYSIFLFLPANIVSTKFGNRKVWLFTSYLVSIPTIILFLTLPSIATSIIFAIGIAFPAANSSLYYLFYSENYHKRVFPFTTISLIYVVILLGRLFSLNIDMILKVIFVNHSYTNDIKFFDNFSYVLFFVSIALIFLCISFLILISIPENEKWFGYCDIQFEKFQPFIWKRGIFLISFACIIVAIEGIGHGSISKWIIAQDTWTKYHDNNVVNLFLRLFEEFHFIPQIILGSLCGAIFYKKIGIKYTFGIGLLLLFIYYTFMSFSSNPITLLLLDFVSGAGYVIIFMTLLSLVLMWQSRTPNKKILPIFSLMIVATKFLTIYIINVLSIYNVWIFQDKNINQTYVQNDEVTKLLNAQTTFMFTGLVITILLLLIVFYYSSEFVLAEYNNDINISYKMKNILKTKIKQIDQKNQKNK